MKTPASPAHTHAETTHDDLKAQAATRTPEVEPEPDTEVGPLPPSLLERIRHDPLDEAWEAAIRSPSAPIPDRAAHERNLGHSLSRVQLHTGPVARTLLDRLGARGATRGDQVLLRSPSDRPALAHELVHAAQPRGPLTHRVLPEHHSAEREAHEAAGRLLAGLPVAPLTQAAPGIALLRDGEAPVAAVPEPAADATAPADTTAEASNTAATSAATSAAARALRSVAAAPPSQMGQRAQAAQGRLEAEGTQQQGELRDSLPTARARIQGAADPPAAAPADAYATQDSHRFERPEQARAPPSIDQLTPDLPDPRQRIPRPDDPTALPQGLQRVRPDDVVGEAVDVRASIDPQRQLLAQTTEEAQAAREEASTRAADAIQRGPDARWLRAQGIQFEREADPDLPAPPTLPGGLARLGSYPNGPPDALIDRLDAETSGHFRGSAAGAVAELDRLDTEREAGLDRARSEARTGADTEATRAQTAHQALEREQQDRFTRERSRVVDAQSRAADDARSRLERHRSDRDGTVERALDSQQRAVDDVWQTADRDARREVGQASSEAERLESDATERGLLGRVADAAVAAVQAMRRAFTQVFDQLRAALGRIFDALRSAVRTAIRAAAEAIHSAIEQHADFARTVLDELVGRAFPGFASDLRTALDAGVDALHTGVDAVADGLEQGMTSVIDGLETATLAVVDTYAQGVDLALQGAEAALTGDWDRFVDIGVEALSLAGDALLGMLRTVAPGLVALFESGPMDWVRSELVEPVGNWVCDQIGDFDLDQTVVEAVEGFETGASDMLGSIEQGIAGFCQSIRDLETKLHNWVTGQRPDQEAEGAPEELLGLGLIVDLQIRQIGALWEVFQLIGTTVCGWLDAAEAHSAELWWFTAGLLGLPAVAYCAAMDGKLDDAAQRAWTFLKEDLGPAALQGLAAGARAAWDMSGLNALWQIIEVVRALWGRLVQLGEWLAGQGTQALEALDQNILQPFLAQVDAFQTHWDAAADWIEGLTGSILEIVEAGLGAVGNVFGAGCMSDLFGGYRRLALRVQGFVLDTLRPSSGGIRAGFAAIRTVFHAIGAIGAMSVMIVNTGGTAIPLIFASGAWLLLPECVKGVIIDVLLDLLILAVQNANAEADVGMLWELFQPMVLQLLDEIRGWSTDDKVAISNRVAGFLTTDSAMFVVGFGLGLATSVVELVTEPILLVVMALDAIHWLLDHLEQAAGVREGDEQSMADLIGLTRPPEQAQDRQGAEARALSEADPATGPPTTDGLARGPPAEGAGSGVNSEVRAAVSALTDGFAGAFTDHFTSSPLDSWGAMEAAFGQLWQSARQALAGQAHCLSEKLRAAFLGGNHTCADEPAQGQPAEASVDAFGVGRAVGWLVGMIVIEVLLAMFSGGLGNAAHAAIEGLRGARVAGGAAARGARGAISAIRAFSGLAGDIASAIRRFLPDAGPIAWILRKLDDISGGLLRVADEAAAPIRMGRGVGSRAGREAIEEATGETVEAIAERSAREARQGPPGRRPNQPEPHADPAAPQRSPAESGAPDRQPPRRNPEEPVEADGTPNRTNDRPPRNREDPDRDNVALAMAAAKALSDRMEEAGLGVGATEAALRSTIPAVFPFVTGFSHRRSGAGRYGMYLHASPGRWFDMFHVPDIDEEPPEYDPTADLREHDVDYGFSDDDWAAGVTGGRRSIETPHDMQMFELRIADAQRRLDAMPDGPERELLQDYLHYARERRDALRTWMDAPPATRGPRPSDPLIEDDWLQFQGRMRGGGVSNRDVARALERPGVHVETEVWVVNPRLAAQADETGRVRPDQLIVPDETLDAIRHWDARGRPPGGPSFGDNGVHTVSTKRRDFTVTSGGHTRPMTPRELESRVRSDLDELATKYNGPLAIRRPQIGGVPTRSVSVPVDGSTLVYDVRHLSEAQLQIVEQALDRLGAANIRLLRSGGGTQLGP